LPRAREYAVDTDTRGEDVSDYRYPANPGAYGVEALDAALSSGLRDRLGRVVGMTVFAVQDEAFFQGVVRFLSVAFDAHLVFLGVVQAPDRGSVRTIAAFQDGLPVPDFEYSLDNTPCETVIRPQNLCIYPSNVISRFPDDPDLVAFEAEGYCGVPLYDSDGELQGIMVALTRTPIEDPPVLATLMLIYAARASLELECARPHRPEDEARLVEAIRKRDRELHDAMEILRTM
jgi:hypothetical protein